MQHVSSSTKIISANLDDLLRDQISVAVVSDSAQLAQQFMDAGLFHRLDDFAELTLVAPRRLARLQKQKVPRGRLFKVDRNFWTVVTPAWWVRVLASLGPLVQKIRRERTSQEPVGKVSTWFSGPPHDLEKPVASERRFVALRSITDDRKFHFLVLFAEKRNDVLFEDIHRFCEQERIPLLALYEGGVDVGSSTPVPLHLSSLLRPPARPDTVVDSLIELCHTAIMPVARRARQKRISSRRSSISNAYGADLILREYCRLDDQTKAVPGYWMHGWIPDYHNIHSEFIALHKKPGQQEDHDYQKQIEYEKVHVPQWVSRKDQADYLLACGYCKVQAIGLPIAYLPKVPVARIPGSLLVMPPHSHNTHGPDDPLAEEYAEVIASKKKNFDHIKVCLNVDDFMKHQWVESFRKRDIDVFIGSDQGDLYTLHRLRRILSSFEYVTTNGYGSHVAYAAYCGAKVSVFGPFAEWPEFRMARTHATRMFPRLLLDQMEVCAESSIRAHMPFLFTQPDHAEARSAWGAEQVGEANVRPPAEIRSLFGW